VTGPENDHFLLKYQRPVMAAILRQFGPKPEKEKSYTPSPMSHRPLLVSSKGLIRQHAEVFENLLDLVPHAKKDQSVRPEDFSSLDEIAADRHCDTDRIFETRHRRVVPECYFWISKVPEGPSISFFIEDAQSIQNLRFIGNCLKGSRPILQFDPGFDQTPSLSVAKSLLQRFFSVPFQERHSKPFVDRTMTFMLEGTTIVIRHYQIQWGEGEAETQLAEVGPRVRLSPVFILAGAFRGKKIWMDTDFTGPYKEVKKERREQAERKKIGREKQAQREEAKMNLPVIQDVNAGLFDA
jgi:ribosome biogenesis protein BRX1